MGDGAGAGVGEGDWALFSETAVLEGVGWGEPLLLCTPIMVSLPMFEIGVESGEVLEELALAEGGLEEDRGGTRTVRIRTGRTKGEGLGLLEGGVMGGRRMLEGRDRELEDSGRKEEILLFLLVLLILLLPHVVAEDWEEVLVLPVFLLLDGLLEGVEGIMREEGMIPLSSDEATPLLTMMGRTLLLGTPEETIGGRRGKLADVGEEVSLFRGKGVEISGLFEEVAESLFLESNGG